MKKLAIAYLATILPIACAYADVITFNEHSHGTVIDSQYQASHGLTISATNPNRAHDVAVLFNSNHPNPTDTDFDTDLIGPPTHDWAGGNISTTALGNLLILAENVLDSNNDSILDDPDDEGRRPAGFFTLDFSDPITQLGFDIVDIENAESGGYYSNFYHNGNLVGTVNFADVLDSNSLFYDPSITFGNNTANIMPTVAANAFGVADFDKVEVGLGGSGGITNVRFERSIPPPNITIPEPSIFLNMLLGLGLLGFLRRRFL